jgi:hypothetical protein
MIANISPAGGSCLETVNTLRYADRVKQIGAAGRAAGAPAGPRLNTAAHPVPPDASRCGAPGPPALFRSAAPLVGQDAADGGRSKAAPRRQAAGEKENVPAAGQPGDDDSLLGLDQLDAHAQQHKRRRSPPPSAGGRAGAGVGTRGGLGLTGGGAGGIFGGDVRPLSLGPELSFPDEGGDEFVFPDEPAAPPPPEPALSPTLSPPPPPPPVRTAAAAGSRPRLRGDRGADGGEDVRGGRGAPVEDECSARVGRGGRRPAAAHAEAAGVGRGPVGGGGVESAAMRPRQFVESFRQQVEKSMMLIEQVCGGHPSRSMPAPAQRPSRQDNQDNGTVAVADLGMRPA